MLAKLKVKLTAVKAYLVLHWKQLTAALAAGKWSSALVAAVTALVHKI